jgi:hypothetical protein
MTYVPFPLDPYTPIADSIPDQPAELITLPQRVRSWSCQTGSALCSDSRCECTCHTDASDCSTFDGFVPAARRRNAFGEVARDLSGARNGFRLGYVGPTSLADLVRRTA